jgi:hypothetical protein
MKNRCQRIVATPLTLVIGSVVGTVVFESPVAVLPVAVAVAVAPKFDGLVDW